MCRSLRPEPPKKTGIFHRRSDSPPTRSWWRAGETEQSQGLFRESGKEGSDAAGCRRAGTLRYIKYRHTRARVKRKQRIGNRVPSHEASPHLFHRFTKELSRISAAFNFNQPCHRSFNGPLIIPEGLVAKPRAKHV